MNNNQELRTIVQIDGSEFPCNLVDTCTYKERTLSFATRVQVPVVATVDPGAVFKECCYTHYVYADSASTDDYKNDYSGFYHQRELSSETVTFKLIDLSNSNEYDLNDSTYGQFFGFGSFPENINFTGYRVDWKKVLAVRGVGSYQIKTNIVKIGITTNDLSYAFTLRQYNRLEVDNTTRIDVVVNGLYQKSGVDFTGIGWRHSLRVGGFFGRRNPSYEERNTINRNFNNRQNSIQQTNEYSFQTNIIPDCISNEIFDFILMSDNIYMNDYNLNNPSYDIIKKGVKFASNEGNVYTNTSRKVQLNLIFNDKILNNLKRNYR